MVSNPEKVRVVLEEFYERYNQPGFVSNDPVSVPHRFSSRQDIEIAGFFAAILGWGQRVTIINKCNDLLNRMDNAPHEFVLKKNERDLRKLETFIHRTFNGTDLLYFVEFLGNFYADHDSLEDAFLDDGKDDSGSPAYRSLASFNRRFFSLPHIPVRTRKHVASPARNASCKRLNMYLRWMVRLDRRGVDFGIWTKLRPADLMCPLDVHVERSSRMLGLLTRKQRDWKAVEELTSGLRLLDPDDPVKYDFALFGMGLENFQI